MKKKVKKVEKLDTEMGFLISTDVMDSINKQRENQAFLYDFIKFAVPSASIIFFSYILELRGLLFASLITAALIALKKAFQKEPQLHLFFPRYNFEPGDKIQIEFNLNDFELETYCLDDKSIEVVEDEKIPDYEILNQVKEELDILYTSYDLPDFNINNEELLTVIKEIEPEFLEEDTYKAMIFLIRMTLAKSIKENKKEINVNYLINNVNYTFGPECDYDEYIRLRNKIKEALKNNKRLQKTLKK